MEIKSTNEKENTIIDSLNYIRKHSSEKKIIEEAHSFLEKTQKIGFLEAQIISNKKTNDTSFSYLISLGKKIKFIHIYIGNKNKEVLEENSDTIKIDFSNSEGYLKDISKKIERKGYSVSKIQLKNIITSHKTIKADLSIELDTKRTINEIVITGYDKFPVGFKRNLEKNLKNKTFNRESLEKINEYFKSINFVRQTKYPEILFNSDTTKVYAYLEKKKNNYFDGFLGFSNSEKNLVLNGYLDLNLNNTLNTGDIFSIKWRSDGKEQKNFNLGIELPFVFKSPINLKLQLNIFKQDSTFQNSKTDIDLGYFINNKSKTYIGYQSTESSDIENINSPLLNDFKNHFITIGFTHTKSTDDFLFPEKTNLNLKIGYGERASKTKTSSQFNGSLNFSYIFDLNKKNSLSISSHNYILLSEDYLINELFRFGGIKSIRGFRENSLQANQANLILSEYRYRFSPTFFIHTILDYGYFKDNTSNTSNKPLGVGFGFGLLNKSSLFNFIYANGIDNKQVVKLSNSIIHISFKTFF